MPKTLDAFMLLLQASLWSDCAKADLLGLSLTPEEWEEVHLLALQHTVTALVFDAVGQLPPQAMPPQELLIRWMAELDAIERINLRMNEALASLIAELQGIGLHPVQLKGQGMADNYPHPLMRECGDIDLYFPRPGERQKAEERMASLGKKLRHSADGSVYYRWQEFIVEHHPALFDMQSPKARRRLQRPDLMQFEPHCIAGSNVWVDVPVPSTCIVLLSAHILKHALGLGIGLRQFCDMARACHVWRDRYNHDFVTDVISEIGLTAWSDLLYKFLYRELHLAADDLPLPLSRINFDHQLLPLWHIILHGGNFGHHAKNAVPKSQNLLRHKFNTTMSFLRNAPFAFRYAPRESVGIVGKLMCGQRLN